MPHRKAEYDASGHSVTIQQVNEGGDVSAWIDGYSAYLSDAIDHVSETSVTELVEEAVDDGRMWDAVHSLLSWMVNEDKYFCSKCESFYDADTVVQTHFAGHKCGECARDDATCADGGDHEWKCRNPRQKHNARVPTKYSCQKCGATKQSTPTG